MINKLVEIDLIFNAELYKIIGYKFIKTSMNIVKSNNKAFVFLICISSQITTG